MMFSRKALLAGAATLVVVSLAVLCRQPQRVAAPRTSTFLPPATLPTPAVTVLPAAPAAEPRQPTLASVSGAAWRQAAEEPWQAAFQDWARRHASASPVGQTALEREGVELARTRLRALAALIPIDPERALQMAVPPAVRNTLPPAVRQHLEEPISARGDYEVLCVLPAAQSNAPAPGLVRTARIAGETHWVYTFGKGLDYLTHRHAPLQGIAVPLAALPEPPKGGTPNLGLAATKLMVLDPTPARLLDETELAAYAAAQAAEPRCTLTGKPWSASPQPAAVEFAGQVYPFSSPVLAARWAETNIAAANLEAPQGLEDVPTAASSYTEGRKRFILYRVDFPDYAGEVMSTNQALNLMSGMSNFMAEISYGKLVIAPVGQGSDITPTMRLPNNVESYRDMGALLGACRTAAAALGYDVNQYDFYFVCTAGKPSASFAGLGYVGGVGFWLANSYWDVRTGAHEYGHNLGLGHANWWDTDGHSMIGAGTSEEYGDVFDTMGINGGGNYHYSSYSKNKLGWIPNGDCPTVTTNGLYRLYAHDDIRASGLRGLRLKRAAGDYWVEFRQKFTNKKALMNGVSLRWVGGSTTLVDINPGSSAGKDDHPLTIGRTFSDAKLGIHITPLGKANTYPESLDVVVNLGAFPANRPPEVTLAASTLAAGVGQSVAFAATATDADGDSLAYYWDFGDGDYSTDNQPAASHGFGSAGEYYVHCTVSDKKGGVAGGAVVVRVGAPTTFRISGRVLTTNNLPVRGVKVAVDSSHYAFTRSDGTYELTRLGAGSYTVTTSEPVYDEANFVNPFFNNPVAIGPTLTTADFIQYPGELNIYTPLVAKGSAWKYLDDGSDQGTAWIAAGFNDNGWSNGTAVFGYGGDKETTVIRYGGDSANKHITYYFRKAFTVANPAAYTNLVLEVLRDDGVLVHLNGQEVFRDNLPAGAVTYTTHAVAAVEPDNYLRSNLPTSVLRAGTNQLAVEIHQVEPTSSDVNFDLALSGLSRTNAGALDVVYLSSPSAGERFAAPANVSLAAVANSANSAVSQVRFYADGAPLAADSTPPYTATKVNVLAGWHQYVAVAVLQNGLLVTSAPVAIEVVEPTPTPPPPVQWSLIATGAFWRFFSAPTGAPPAWAQTAFNDTAWTNGRAQLGYGENDETTRVSYGTDGNNKWVTAYFRKAFTVADPFAITNLALQLKRDDGAIVYLNGEEILRDLMPTGAVTYATLATNAADDGQTFNSFNFGPLPLQPGTNVLAVEVHQSAVTSSDLSFDLSLTALAATNRPRGLWITAPLPQAPLSAGSPILLASEPVAGGALGVASVTYFANGQPIGEAGFPYQFTWTNPLVGDVQLIAVATDSAGGAITSAPVNVVIAAPPPVRAWVSFGEVWKYQDDGLEPPANWVRLTYDDRAWSAGAARLGYGGDGELTQLSDGGDPTFRHITAYFRKTFLANPAGMARLRLRLICDDGAVVYLNGREVLRHNLKSGLVSFNSLATNTVGGAAESTPLEIELGLTNLLSGTNLLAVEIHQASITSSDLGFDLELSGLAAAPAAGGVYLTAPGDGARYYSPAQVALTAFAATNGQAASLVEYFAGPLKIGQATAYPFAATWANPAPGAYSLWARATFAGGLVVTSAPVAVFILPPPPVIQPVAEVLIPESSLWSFWDNVTAVAPGWTLPAFDDAAWPIGQARFGWGYDGEKTELTSGRITHYFRKSFVVANPALFTELSFQLARDDGAVVYLNGREIFRSNLPAGGVTASTLASTTVNTPDETTFFETVLPVAGAGLQAGTNWVAVELHQGSATSSDAGFDLRLLAYGTTEPRIYFLSPAAGQSFVYGQPLALEAWVWADSGVADGAVEFWADGLKLGEAAVGAARFVWTNAPLGSHVLTVRTASGLESPPVNITVTYQPVSLSLIATGAAWRYWDRAGLPAVNWMARAYNDASWSNGLARLGYGDDGERTPIRYGANANNKYPTAYFRSWFNVPSGVTLTNLVFRLLRDDGAVVYLNGVEVYRSNLPTGAVTYATLASSAISGAGEQTYYATSVPVGGLLPGAHLVAVEIHQSSVTSSDLGFDLELLGEGYSGREPAAAVAAAPVPNQPLQLIWPTNLFGWALYSTTNLGPGGAWTPVTSGITATNGWYLHTVLPNGSRAFYRLELR